MRVAATEQALRTPSVDPRVTRTRQDVLPVAAALLLDEGWAAVTHQRVAREAGYAKATLYAHWPTRTDLLVDLFTRFVEVPHHTPTGDLRADLVAELTTFRTAVAELRLDRVLAVLVDLTASVPELAEVRERVATEGEQVIRALLAPHLDGVRLEAATRMLAGSLVQSALLHGTAPDPPLIEALVDLTLTAIQDRDR